MEVDAVVDVLEAVLWKARVSPAVRGEAAVPDEMKYSQKASPVHSP